MLCNHFRDVHLKACLFRGIIGLTILFIMLPPRADAQPQTDVRSRFQQMIASEPASEILSTFAKTLQSGDFTRLKDFLDFDTGVIQKRRIREAFIRFTKESGRFRHELTAFVLAELPVNELSVRSRGLLVSLVEYAAAQGTRPIDVPVYQALSRHRGIRERVEIPQSLGQKIRGILKMDPQEGTCDKTSFVL